MWSSKQRVIYSRAGTHLLEYKTHSFYNLPPGLSAILSHKGNTDKMFFLTFYNVRSSHITYYVFWQLDYK